jgi:hypothetical protein
LKQLDEEREYSSKKRVAFSAYHSTELQDAEAKKDTSTLMPLLNESINSQAMVCHCLTIISKLMLLLNSVIKNVLLC